MNIPTVLRSLVFGLLLAGPLLFLPTVLAIEAEAPRILSIQENRGKLVIHASVPAGLKKVTLQTRTRIEGSTWVPRAVNRLDGAGGTTTFFLSKDRQFELIRVQAEPSDALPESFYQGTNAFNGAGGGSTTGTTGGVFIDGGATGGTTAGPVSVPVRDNEANSGGGNRAVVESDIWKIEGNFVYFFNAYRGLQVIDATNPDAPVIKSQYALPGSGEQMYVNNGIVILLTQVSCNAYETNFQSEVVILDANGAAVNKLASVQVPGTIRESRLVGNALYVVSQTYAPREKGVWEWGSAATSFDLTNPAAPVKKQTIWLPGNGNVIAATDRFLFVVQNNYRYDAPQDVHVIDISSHTGEMAELSKIRTAGQVPDKFKINVSGNIVTIISQAFNQTDRWLTVLETFSMENPAAPQKLGRLELARGEQLHATRFDGDRAYIVTFFRTDPLWVVDLSDPARPKISGELIVPGWSTYIQPLGDRLVAIGIDIDGGWKVAVSLFDVSNPAKPSLVDKEFLGQNNSWSEANNDEKAFNVMPEAGLILVPYQGYVTNGYAQNVQLIDFDRNSLTKRGEIKHSFQPRRAGMLKDRILSISARELLSVNATNRDEPVVSSTLTLSANIAKVYPVGNFIVSHAGNNNWDGKTAAPVIQVSSKAAPDRPLTQLTLAKALPVLGSAQKGNYLYLLQPGTGYSVTAEESTNPPPATLTVVDLSNLPQLTIASTTPVASTITAYSTAEALWPNDDVLVFKVSNGYNYYWGWGGREMPGIAIGGGAGMVTDALWYPWWGGGAPAKFLAFDVKETGKAKFSSVVTWESNGYWWSGGKTFALNNLIYTSHSQYDEKMVVTPAPAEGGAMMVVGKWQTRYYLDVIDYSDPAEPAKRPAANLPSALEGVSHHGNLLYTWGPHFTPEGDYAGYNNWIDALAYDGVSAHLVNSLETDNPSAYKITTDGVVYLGTSATTNNPPQIVTFSVSIQGKFIETSRTDLASQVTAFAKISDVLLVQTNNRITPFEPLATPQGFSLRKLNDGVPSGCIYGDITRAEGSKAEGIWLPLLDYGLIRIPTE